MVVSDMLDVAYSLVRSEILQPRDLDDRNLGGALHLQRLYCSNIQGRAAFFEYLRYALQNYGRRVIILKVSELAIVIHSRC